MTRFRTFALTENDFGAFGVSAVSTDAARGPEETVTAYVDGYATGDAALSTVWAQLREAEKERARVLRDVEAAHAAALQDRPLVIVGDDGDMRVVILPGDVP